METGYQLLYAGVNVVSTNLNGNSCNLSQRLVTKNRHSRQH